jgi:hypothetical protein
VAKAKVAALARRAKRMLACILLWKRVGVVLEEVVFEGDRFLGNREVIEGMYVYIP